jgi:hypothetical protein
MSLFIVLIATKPARRAPCSAEFAPGRGDKAESFPYMRRTGEPSEY